jgi:plastocyanin
MKVFFLSVAAALAAASPALANGTVTGTVRIEAVPPEAAAVKIAKDATVCGKEARSEALRVGTDRQLADVVVVVRGLKAARPPAPTPNAVLDQVGCRYTPHVQAVTVGTPLGILNNDAVFHNVHANRQEGDRQVTVFNLAMPMKGQKLPTVMKKPGVIKVRCDAGHTWMSAYVHVFDHPYFAVTDQNGAFVIKDVPPGRHTVEYWHEPVTDKGPPLAKTATVEVVAGQAAVADVELTSR